LGGAPSEIAGPATGMTPEEDRVPLVQHGRGGFGKSALADGFRASGRAPVFDLGADGYVEWFDEYPAGYGERYWPAPPGEECAGGVWCQLHGDSMIPDVQDGDMVYFCPAFTAFAEGNVCLVRTHEFATLKRVYGAGGSRLRLQPSNTAYESRTVDREADVIQLRPAVYLLRRLAGSGEPT